MKASILLSLIIFCCVNLNAQISKGTWIVGGTGSFLTGKEAVSPRTNTFLNIAPRGGYFIAKQFVVGATVSYSFNKQKFSENLKSTANSFGIGPFARYYFFPASKKINFLTEAYFGLQFFSSSSAQSPPLPPVRSSGSSYEYAFRAGMALFLNPNVAIEILPGYLGYDPDKSTMPRQFTVNAGFQIHLNTKK